MNRFTRALCVAICLGLPASAWAQPAASPPAADAPTAEDLESARVDLAAGDAHYDAGRYDDAIAAYQRGYDKSKKPGFLYNIAQAQRLAGHCADAVATYQAYLEADPDSVRRAQVEGHIREIEACAEEERAAAAAEIDSSTSAADTSALATREPPADATPPSLVTSPSPPADDRGGTSLRWIGVGVAAAGAVGLGTSAYFMSAGKGREDDIAATCTERSPCSSRDYAALRDDGEAANRNAWITGIGGGVLLAGGLTLILVDLAGGGGDDTVLSIAPHDGGAAFVYAGRF